MRAACDRLPPARCDEIASRYSRSNRATSSSLASWNGRSALNARRRIGRGGGRAQHERQRLEVVVGAGERDRARDHVAQLAHVAGPVIALEPLERGAADLRRELRARRPARGTSAIERARGRRVRWRSGGTWTSTTASR